MSFFPHLIAGPIVRYGFLRPQLAAVELLRQEFPEMKIRVVNVVDLMKLQPQKEHPHGLSDDEFDLLFTTNKPIIFAFHGDPWLIQSALACKSLQQPL
jgi:phosphoketolase